MSVVVSICTGVVSALVAILALVSYRKQRIRSTIEYWNSTFGARYAARQYLPFERDVEDVKALIRSVQTLDHDIAMANQDPRRLRWQFDCSGVAMNEAHWDLALRLTQRSHLYRYLGLIETLGAGVKEKAFSLGTIRTIDGNRLREVWVAYGELIEDWRISNNDPTMYVGIESLAGEL